MDSRGPTPASKAETDDSASVLNAGASGGVAGLRNHGDTLWLIAGSAGMLSANCCPTPTQVGFSVNDDVLVVTECDTRRATSFVVKPSGTLDGKTIGDIPTGSSGLAAN